MWVLVIGEGNRASAKGKAAAALRTERRDAPRRLFEGLAMAFSIVSQRRPGSLCHAAWPARAPPAATASGVDRTQFSGQPYPLPRVVPTGPSLLGQLRPLPQMVPTSLPPGSVPPAVAGGAEAGPTATPLADRGSIESHC